MSPSVLIALFASIGFLLTAIYVASARRHKPTWIPGVILLLSCGEVTLVHVLRLTSPEIGHRIFWYKMAYFGFTIAPGAFLWLALMYCGLWARLSQRLRLGLLVAPILTNLMVISNEMHGLFWNPANTHIIANTDSFLSITDAGIGYWAFVAYSFSIMGIGCFFLGRLLVRSHHIYGWQVSAIVVAGILAMLGSALDIFGWSPLPSFSLTALGLAIGSITVAYMLAPFRRRDVLSVSRATIIRNISDGIIVIDEEHKIVEINPAAEAIIDKPADQVMRKSLVNSIPELKSIWDCIPNNAEITLIRDGSPRTFDLRVSVIQDWQGRLASQVIVLREITERKRAEEKMRDWNIELERRVSERTQELAVANKELEAFAYTISHDLRAPLRIIDGYINIIYEDYGTLLDEEGRSLCITIHNRALYMHHLIDDILTLSRFSRAQMRLAHLNMVEMVGSVIQELTAALDRERIEFHIDLLLQAYGDPTLIQQVWTNILSNAIKYSQKRERAIIEINSRQVKNEIIYMVKDNGAGFDMVYADKIFGAFQRLHSEKDFPGTGVGLAIVQRIIHRHGGRVWAESQSDQGATFYFSLPKKPV